MSIRPTDIADDVEIWARAREPTACLIGNVTAANLLDLVADYRKLRAATTVHRMGDRDEMPEHYWPTYVAELERQLVEARAEIERLR